MDVLMEIDENHIEGAMGKEFIRRGLCPELSLGYNVTMSKSPAGFLRATNKKVVELSIVRQGARAGCMIRAFTNGAVKNASKMAGTMFQTALDHSSSSSSSSSGSRKPGAPVHKVLV